ncbi:MAG: glycosyltransferase family 4 protein [Defluviicoccus sp.]|nr:MAG: glycosyltransferase family 4 protein [Defluviicoccus sp.]
MRFDVVDITHAEVVRIEDAGHDGAGAEIVRTEVTRAKVAEVEIRGSEVEQKEKATGAEAPAAETAAPVAAAVEAPAREATPSHAEQTLARLSVAKRALALEPTAPVVLFAGDIGWHGGADILFEAMLIVCAGHPGVQFVYAGDGALRGELQERASRVALGSRCRFLGDIPAERFGEFLDAADFVAIPARSPQGEDLALAMLAQGKPVLVTHQSGIGCVVHGRNGLVTYDNPGSFVWGVRELLGPLYGELLRQMDQMDRAA